MAKTSVLFTLLIFSAFQTIALVYSLSQNNDPCLSIIEVASASSEPLCTPLGDCTGLSCFSNSLNQTVVIVVDKCTDPLEVNITLYGASGSPLLTDIITGTGDVSTGNSTVNVSLLERNQFSATVMVMYVLDGGVQITAVPAVEIPLNASDCMCASVKHIGENVESPVETNCMVNSECIGQECEFQFGALNLVLESDIIPCADPPGFVFIVRDKNSNNVVSEHYFDGDKTVTFLNTFPLSVTVEHRKYSMIISGKLFVNSNVYNVIPKTQIIIDKSVCLLPMIMSSSTVMPFETPKPMAVIVSPQTCKVIEDIRDETNSGDLTSCSVNSAAECDTVTCVTFNEYNTSFQLKPCLDPPAVHVIISEHGAKLYDDVISETTTIPVGTAGFVLTVGLTQEDSGLGIQVNGSFGPQPFPIIEKKTIPIDICYCPRVHCSSLVLPLSSKLFTETMPPTATRGSSINTVAIVLPLSSKLFTETMPPTATRGSSTNTVAIVVPTTMLLLIAVIGIIIIAVVSLIVVRKRVAENSAKADSVSFKEIIYSDENADEI